MARVSVNRVRVRVGTENNTEVEKWPLKRSVCVCVDIQLTATTVHKTRAPM